MMCDQEVQEPPAVSDFHLRGGLIDLRPYNGPFSHTVIPSPEAKCSRWLSLRFCEVFV